MNPMSILLLLPLNGDTSEQLKVNKRWGTTPNILICKASQTAKETIEEAAKYWQRHGFKVGTISSGNDEQACQMTEPLKRGYIIFMGSKGLDTKRHYAITQPWYRKSTQKMVSASIRVQEEYSNNLKLITHELGHALGLLHVDDKNSVMYEWHRYEVKQHTTR